MAKHFDSETIGAKLGTLESHYGTIGAPLAATSKPVVPNMGHVYELAATNQGAGLALLPSSI